MKKYIEHINPIEFTPAASSFVFYPGKKQVKRRSARFANMMSIKRIFNDFPPGKIAYIDEIVSGSMMLRAWRVAAYSAKALKKAQNRGKKSVTSEGYGSVQGRSAMGIKRDAE